MNIHISFIDPKTGDLYPPPRRSVYMKTGECGVTVSVHSTLLDAEIALAKDCVVEADDADWHRELAEFLHRPQESLPPLFDEAFVKNLEEHDMRVRIYECSQDTGCSEHVLRSGAGGGRSVTKWPPTGGHHGTLQKRARKWRTKMQLYRVISVLNEYRGHKDVKLTWCLAPTPVDEEDLPEFNDRQVVLDFVGELFNEDEARALLAHVGKEFPGEHRMLQVKVPISEILGARSHEGVGTDGRPGCITPVDWPLPFAVFASYHLGKHEKV